MSTTTVPPTIRRAEPNDVDAIADLFVEAFLHGDLGPWLIPRIDTRLRIYRDYFQIHAEHALTAGWVDIVGTFDGVAVWYEVKNDPDRELAIPDYDARIADACGPYTPQFAAVDRAMATHHPRGVAHHYLALLAVHPDHQRRGIGSASLDHHHDVLDAAGVPSYLEATGHRNGALYLRHRYRRQRPYLVGDNTKLYPMWRTPRTTAAPKPAWADTTEELWVTGKRVEGQSRFRYARPS